MTVEAMIEYAAMALLACDEDQWDRLPQDEQISVKSEVEDALKTIGLPLETLAALKAGTWRAVPVKPTDGMLDELDVFADGRVLDEGLAIVWAAALTAAPAKPGDNA